jgi:hypothetical protein
MGIGDVDGARTRLVDRTARVYATYRAAISKQVPPPVVARRCVGSIYQYDDPASKMLVFETDAGQARLSDAVIVAGWAAGLPFARLTNDINTHTTADIHLHDYDINIDYLKERGYSLAHFHTAPDCRSMCGAANGNYGRHKSLYSGHGDDLPSHLATRLGLANQCVAWVESFPAHLAFEFPLSTFSLEQPKNHFWKSDAAQSFAFKIGALKLPYSRNCERYGESYNKPGIFASNLVTVPWNNFAIDALSVPTTIGAKCMDLGAAAAYPPKIAQDWASAIVDHHWLRINRPKEFLKFQARFERLLADQMKDNKFA